MRHLRLWGQLCKYVQCGFTNNELKLYKEVSFYDDCKAALYYISGVILCNAELGGGVYIDNNNTLIHNATAVNCMNW